MVVNPVLVEDQLYFFVFCHVNQFLSPGTPIYLTLACSEDLVHKLLLQSPVHFPHSKLGGITEAFSALFNLIYTAFIFLLLYYLSLVFPLPSLTIYSCSDKHISASIQIHFRIASPIISTFIQSLIMPLPYLLLHYVPIKPPNRPSLSFPYLFFHNISCFIASL